MIKLMIDSAADISKQEADEKGIIMIPMLITIGEEEFYDGVNLSPQGFWEKLIESDVLPKTSLINTFRFEEAFEKHTRNGDELIVITISSKLSGTYESARQAAEKFPGKVYVVDSLNACVGERLLCDFALRLLKQGLSAKAIIEELEDKKKNIKVMALLGTLAYLKKGGRISSTVAFAGEMISLKPVVGIVDGEVKLIGKALGSRKGNNLLSRLVQEVGGIDFSMPYATIWSGLDNSLLDKYIKDSASLWAGHTDNIPKHILGATIGTHVGPGVVGVAFFENREKLK
ncbi:MAG: DegV family protein [Clostridia bacterium]|nr:DegV family protein [Clostridia bacterium]MBO5067824.1 DegV family protein [Clostridia bacterium]